MEKPGFKKAAPSLVITSACVWAFLANKSFTFDSCSPFSSFLLYHFSHANIFHLAANIMALLYFRPRISTSLVAFLSASVSAMMPLSAVSMPTCGLSAFIFAAYARKYYYWGLPLKGILISIAVTAFIPMLNWKLHLLSFIMSFTFWMLYDTIRTWNKPIS